MTMPSGVAAQSAGVMSGAEPSVLLGGVTLAAGQVVDVRLHGGSIAEVGTPGTLPAADEHLDLSGYLLLPAPAEPHAHLDTALTADRVDNPTGDLPGAIQAWLDYQGSVTRDDFVRRATEAAKLGLANGTTAIRSHVGIYQAVGTKAVEALLEVREALRGWVDIQLVALNVRLSGPDCADMRALLRAAMEMGVDVVGGCPHLDPDPVAYHNLTLSLAAEFGRPIDLHTDETLDPAVLHLPHLADLVAETGFPHGATASHCVSLGVQPSEVAAQVAERVAAAGVAVVCNPQTNLGLQARAAGHLTPEEAYAAVSLGARAAMGLPEVRVEAGFPAELLAVRAASLGEAIAGGTCRVVIHQGRVVSRTTVTREFPGANGTALAGDRLLL